MLDNITFALDPAIRATVLGVAVGFMALEYLLGRLTEHDTHDLKESATSLGLAVGQNLIRAIEAGFVSVPFVIAYEHRWFDIEALTPWGLAALFVATEFAYYWQHRSAHHIRWMWATHSVHHSATRLNLTAAIRLGWTGQISGNFLFFVPLCLIGFHPLAVVGMLAANLIYQLFIHTELVRDLGPLEWVLNTPAHHRVHHASNAQCLDTNFGGILIVFDRLFGSFARAPEDEALRYGLVGRTPSYNPIKVAFGEWAAIVRDFRRARALRDGFRALFIVPEFGSQPGDGARPTVFVRGGKCRPAQRSDAGIGASDFSLNPRQRRAVHVIRSGYRWP
jgi:sterol desaturase/sphingolipid hydroxylase (fatty acid hydroxylase superfamily)